MSQFVFKPDTTKGNVIVTLASIPSDVLVLELASQLDVAEIVRLRAMCKHFHHEMLAEEIWLNKLTVLCMKYPVVDRMDRAPDETAFAWYARCQSAVTDIDTIAQKHLRSTSTGSILSSSCTARLSSTRSSRTGRSPSPSSTASSQSLVNSYGAQAKRTPSP